MKVLSWEAFAAGGGPGFPISAAVGVFDGLHIGHRELVGRVLGREGLVPAVVTFEVNPKRILSPSTFHGELSTLGQRLDLIAGAGVELCVLIDFSGDFSKLPGRQFLTMLSESGDLRFLAVGSGFRCGHRLDTDARGIREFCAARSIGVELLEAVHWAGSPVSSSRIRKAVLEGRLEDAARMLGRPYEIDLRGARALSPAGLLPAGGQACPPPGRYDAAVRCEGRDGDPDEGAAVVAELGIAGVWSFSSEGILWSWGSAPIGLRLVRMVSRG